MKYSDWLLRTVLWRLKLYDPQMTLQSENASESWSLVAKRNQFGEPANAGFRGTHMAKPAFSTFKVLMSVLFVVGGAGCCRVLRNDEDQDAVALFVLRRLVANLRAHRLASSAVAQARPVRVVLLPKKIPGVGCRRQAVRRWQLADVWAEESSRWEGTGFICARARPVHGPLTGDKRMTANAASA
jgi:hypothetical protein